MHKTEDGDNHSRFQTIPHNCCAETMEESSTDLVLAVCRPATRFPKPKIYVGMDRRRWRIQCFSGSKRVADQAHCRKMEQDLSKARYEFRLALVVRCGLLSSMPSATQWPFLRRLRHHVARRTVLPNGGRSRCKDSCDIFEPSGNDTPPHPTAPLLTNDESRLGENSGVMRDSRLAFS